MEWTAKAEHDNTVVVVCDCPTWAVLECFVSWAQSQGLTVRVTSPKGKTFGMSLKPNPCR